MSYSDMYLYRLNIYYKREKNKKNIITFFCGTNIHEIQLISQ